MTDRRGFLKLLSAVPIMPAALKLDAVMAEVPEPTVERLTNLIERPPTRLTESVIRLSRIMRVESNTHLNTHRAADWNGRALTVPGLVDYSYDIVKQFVAHEERAMRNARISHGPCAFCFEAYDKHVTCYGYLMVNDFTIELDGKTTVRYRIDCNEPPIIRELMT